MPIFFNYLPPSLDEACPSTYDFKDLETISSECDLSQHSQSVSRFLNGPMPYPKIELERQCYVEGCSNNFSCCGTSALPSQLLDVCTAVSNEVEQIFYSEIRFLSVGCLHPETSRSVLAIITLYQVQHLRLHN